MSEEIEKGKVLYDGKVRRDGKVLWMRVRERVFEFPGRTSVKSALGPRS